MYLNLIITIFIGYLCSFSYCQENKEQQLHALLSIESNNNHDHHTTEVEVYDQSFLSSDDQSTTSKIITFPFSGMMYMYQHFISGQLYGVCMYNVTCSNFSKQCIHQYGLVKGLFLSTDRLSRCTTMCLHDYPDYKINTNQLVIDLPAFYSIR